MAFPFNPLMYVNPDMSMGSLNLAPQTTAERQTGEWVQLHRQRLSWKRPLIFDWISRIPQNKGTLLALCFVCQLTSSSTVCFPSISLCFASLGFLASNAPPYGYKGRVEEKKRWWIFRDHWNEKPSGPWRPGLRSHCLGDLHLFVPLASSFRKQTSARPQKDLCTCQAVEVHA